MKLFISLNFEKKLARSATKDWTLKGAKLHASIGPASWMYNGYGLLVKVDMNGGVEGGKGNGGTAFVISKEKPFEECVTSDFAKLCKTVKVIPCSKCGKPAFDPKAVDTNRGGLCETCFVEAREVKEHKQKDASKPSKNILPKAIVDWATKNKFKKAYGGGYWSLDNGVLEIQVSNDSDGTTLYALPSVSIDEHGQEPLHKETFRDRVTGKTLDDFYKKVLDDNKQLLDHLKLESDL